MPITYPLELPTAGFFVRARPGARSVVGVTESPYTLQQQVQAHQGQRWQAEVTVVPMPRAEAELWVAFLLKLNGREGTFLWGAAGGSRPRGAAASAAGTPVVDGAGQTGSDLAIRGAPASVTGWLLPGDLVQLGAGDASKLYKVLDAADTDGSGDTTLTLWPKIRTAPLDGSTLTVSDAKGLWRLASNVTEWDLESVLYGITFGAVQAL